MRLKRLAVIATLVFLSVVTMQAQTFTTLHDFTGSTDGGSPYAGVTMANGNLYGTASGYGADGKGSVYEVSSTGSETTLYSFTGSPDGETPWALVKRGYKGNLYGTTGGGGAYGWGAVFEVDSTGRETVLYSFSGGARDGCYPSSGLLEYGGDLYGTTTYCGAYNEGTIFKLTKKGKETVLHSFAGGSSDGAYPGFAGLIVDEKDAAFYSLTEEGGSTGQGTVYRMTKKGKVSVLHSFGGGASDGCYPYGTPALDKEGNLYGTTETCGVLNYGTIWKVNQKGEETILHNFSGGNNDGEYPYSGIVLDAEGTVYGTATFGGNNHCYDGCGVVYELKKSGKLTLLHSFGYSDGAWPYGQVLIDSKGDVYGTTYGGGTGDSCAIGCGTVWSYVP